MRSAAMAHLLCAARPPRRGDSGSGRSRQRYDTPITWLRKAILKRLVPTKYEPAEQHVAPNNLRYCVTSEDGCAGSCESMPGVCYAPHASEQLRPNQTSRWDIEAC